MAEKTQNFLSTADIKKHQIKAKKIFILWEKSDTN